MAIQVGELRLPYSTGFLASKKLKRQLDQKSSWRENWLLVRIGDYLIRR
jgi:hypothetical protein